MSVVYKGFGRAGLAAIFSFLDYREGAEIGVAGGNFSYLLAKTDRNVKLYSIDPWADNEAYYLKALSKLSAFDNVEIIRKTSADACGMFEDGQLDYIYIDAAHDYENVIHDISVWDRKVRRGGIVSGHDYSRNHPGVIRAVDEYASTEKVYVLVCTSWFWVKQ